MSFLRHDAPIPEKGRGSRLTGKQMRFVDEFTNPSSDAYRNASKAVLAAGYKTRNQTKIGIELLQHPLVVREIKAREDATRERHELTADYVISKLMTLAEDTMRDSDRIRALELLGKTLSLFKERQEISGPDGEAIRYEQKVKENVSDFTSKLSRLSQTSSDTENVVPLRRSDAS